MDSAQGDAANSNSSFRPPWSPGYVVMMSVGNVATSSEATPAEKEAYTLQLVARCRDGFDDVDREQLVEQAINFGYQSSKVMWPEAVTDFVVAQIGEQALAQRLEGSSMRLIHRENGKQSVVDARYAFHRG